MGLYKVCWVLLAVLAVAHGWWPFSRTVPKQKLKSGGSIPMLGMGTWMLTNETEAEAALDLALTLGFRHFDTATAYQTEKYVGNVLKRWIDSGRLQRKDVFITTKLVMTSMRAEDVPGQMKQSLENLQLDYVDMWLIHQPWGVKSGMTLVMPNSADETVDHAAIWRAMEYEFRAGRTKALGVANMNETQVERISRIATVPISDWQVELQVEFQQQDLLAFAKKRGIRVTAYSPLGSPGSTYLTETTGKPLPRLFEIPIVKEIAARHNKIPAQVLLRYSIQRGVIVIPKSATLSHVRENINIFDFRLSRREMDQLHALDKGMVKGKIFDLLEFPAAKESPEYPWTAFLQQ